MLPVLEGGIDNSAQADRSVDLLPAFLVPDQQPIGRRNQNPPVGIGSNISHRAAWNGRVWPSKSGLAGRQHEHTRIPRSYPKTTVVVFPDCQPISIRKSTVSPEDGRPIPVHAAQLLSAPVPQDVAIHGNAIGARPGCSGRSRKPAHGEPIVPGFGIELHQTGVSANKRVPFPIRLDTLCPTDRLEIDGKLLETVARQLVEPEVSSHQKRAIGSVAKRSARSGRNSLLRSKRLEAFPVVPENAVLRAHPNETRAVLIDLPDGKVAEAFRDPEVAEVILLSARDHGCQQEEGEYSH